MPVNVDQPDLGAVQALSVVHKTHLYAANRGGGVVLLGGVPVEESAYLKASGLTRGVAKGTDLNAVQTHANLARWSNLQPVECAGSAHANRPAGLESV